MALRGIRGYAMMGGLPEDLREIEIWNRFQCRTP